jgi:hypothetical protein
MDNVQNYNSYNQGDIKYLKVLTDDGVWHVPGGIHY